MRMGEAVGHCELVGGPGEQQKGDSRRGRSSSIPRLECYLERILPKIISDAPSIFLASTFLPARSKQSDHKQLEEETREIYEIYVLRPARW